MILVEEQLRVHGRTSLIEALREGLSSIAVRDRLAAARLPSVAAVEEWFGWHDGVALPDTRIVDDLELIPGFFPMSLDEAITLRSDYLADDAWSPSFLPILTNGAGDHLVVDLDGDLDPGVRRWEFDEQDHPVAFVSLAALARTIEQGYVRGVITVDERGYLIMDQRRFEELAVKETVRALEQLGPMPTNVEADRAGNLLERWEQLLTDLAEQGNLTDLESARLVPLFPNDDSDCYGLAWTLVHLVESAPSWPIHSALQSATGPWAAVLGQRAASARD